jgi:hypothetical protein
MSFAFARIENSPFASELQVFCTRINDFRDCIIIKEYHFTFNCLWKLNWEVNKISNRGFTLGFESNNLIVKKIRLNESLVNM